MSRFGGAQKFRDVSAKEAGKLKNVGPAVSKTEVARQALEAKRILDDANLVPDDGIPPGVPVNVRTEALRRGVRVTWNAPPEEEYVEKTRVKVTNAVSTGRVLLQEAAAGTSATVVDLPTEEHLVEVQHVDQWGLTSPWSAFVTVTPLKSVADLIDLAAAEIAGKLGWTNIAALTDPANLGDKVITSRAMATQNFAALSAWIEGAAIKDALIGDLKADKITTGSLTAELGITTGKLTWPGGLLDVPILTRLGSRVQPLECMSFIYRFSEGFCAGSACAVAVVGVVRWDGAPVTRFCRAFVVARTSGGFRHRSGFARWGFSVRSA